MSQQYDVIIAGAGVSGLFCALSLPKNCNILVLSKDRLDHSDSYLAQGGISVLLDASDYDTYFEDTLKAGHYENNREAVDIMIRTSREIIDDLIAYGVTFDKKGNQYDYTREGAHSSFRILHHDDLTGKEITSKLLAQAQKRKNITILEYAEMLDIIASNNHCYGVVYQQNQQLKKAFSKFTVFATGGLGGLFKNSTNFPVLQPTTFDSKKPGRRFLISESVRGEGAYLLNKDGKRFTDELQPRDVVSDAILKEMEKDNTDYVYLSVTHLPAEKIKERFPNIYEHCLEEGYDMTKEPIPVTPAQHYFMGGVKVDCNSYTSMENLYTVGECACNGVHGRNRLASNSLLESIVFAKRAALDMAQRLDQTQIETKDIDLSPYKNAAVLEEEYKKIVLNEIKRKDEKFYDKWCKSAD